MRLKQFDKIERFLVFVGAFSIFLYSISFEYCDGRTLTVWSYNIWDALFNGQIFDFYECTLENVRGAQHSMCGGAYFPLVPIAIWNFPIWIICKICGIIDVSSGFFLIWTKVFYVVLLGLTIYRMYGISQIIQGKVNYYKKYIFLLMFGSAEILFSIGYAGQDEIVYLFFIIQALYYYFRKEKNKFYIYSILSIMCCEIMLIPYLLIIVFDDKKWYSIISKALVALLPNQILSIIYAGDLRFRHVQGDNFFEWFFGRNVINTGWGGVSLLAIAIVFVFAYAFFYRAEDKTQQQISGDKLYCISLLISAVTFLGWDQFYRTFIWLPFVVLYIVNCHLENIQVNLLIVTLIEIIRTLMDCISKPVLFRPEYISNGLVTFLNEKGMELNGNYNGVLDQFITTESTFYILLNSVMVGAILVFFYINNKGIKGNREIYCSDKLLMAGYFLIAPLLFLLFFCEILLP